MIASTTGILDCTGELGYIFAVQRGSVTSPKVVEPV